MAFGIVILAHEHLNRTRQVVRAIAGSECKVVVHVDARADRAAAAELRANFRNNQNVVFAEPLACDWGRFSLVRAALSSAELLLKTWPDVSHVAQISGACLPVRPIGELAAFLADRLGEDFVDCTPVTGERWVKDGLNEERFTLYFPVSWKRRRWLFDRLVDAQRWLGVNRRIPKGLTPHLGSQWWCLSAETLRGILTDPRRKAFDRFFRLCWIPDESYVPTLVHRHTRKLNRASLTLSRFDHQGKPFIFYDDHALLLEQTDFFFVRKVWHGADALYRRFLNQKRLPLNRPIAQDLGLGLIFDRAEAQRCKGRTGLLNAGRFPSPHFARQPQTCRPYTVFVGFQSVYDGFDQWLEATTGALAHGRVFQRNRVNFALGLPHVAAGSLPSNPLIRDENPEQFLTSLLWNQRDRHQSMLFEMSDGRRMGDFLIRDPNAALFMLKGSWLLELYHRRLRQPAARRMQAERLANIERKIFRAIEREGRKDVSVLSLYDMLHDTSRLLRFVQDMVRPDQDLRPVVALALRDLAGLRAFVEELSADGVDVSALGRLPDCLPGEAPWQRPERILAQA